MKYLFSSCFFLLTFLVGLGQDSGTVIFDTTSYYKSWEKIDHLFGEEGLNRTAQKEVEKLYESIKDGNNPAQIYKCILYKRRLAAMVDENGSTSLISALEKELSSSEFPIKALISSVLADSYVDYLNRNRWKIMQRKLISDSILNYEQWSLRQFNERIIELLLLSVGDDRLKEIGLDQITAIIRKGNNTDSYEHSIYDLLASKALEHFKNRSLFIQNIESSVDMSDSNFFSIESDELYTAIQLMDDKEQYPYWILSLFHELEEYNRKYGYAAALHRFQLQRLDFVNEHFNGSLREERYLKTLKALQLAAEKDESYGLICHKLGGVYWSKSSEQVKGPKPDPRVAKKLREWQSTFIKKARSYWLDGKAAFPGTKGSLLCKRMLAHSERKSLSISVENRVIPNKAFLVQIDYKQVDTFDLYLHKFSYSEWLDYQDIPYGEKVEFLKNRKPFRVQNIELKKSNDYLSHRLEIMHEGLEEGYYILTPSTFDRKYSSKDEFLVTNLHVNELTGLENGYRKFQILDRSSGKSLAGLKLKLERFSGRRNDDVEKISYHSTDEQGELLLQFEKNKKYALHVFHGIDSVHNARSWYTYSSSNQRDKGKYDYQTFTDRSIYRSGQTIHFKTIVLWDKGSSPVEIKENKELEISLKDPYGEELHSEWYKTNEFGSISGHFTLPKDAVNGYYTIENSLGYKDKDILVEAYKRPTFELSLDQPKGEISIGDRIMLEGKALTYSGAPLQEANLTYSVYCSYQPFFYWGFTGRNRYIPWSKEIFIEAGVVVVDSKGKFSLNIDAVKALPQYVNKNHLLNFRVQVKGTDISGESQELSQHFLVGEHGLKIGVQTAEHIMEGEDIKANISVTNVNGISLERNIETAIYRLESPRQNYLKKYWTNTDLPLISRDDYVKYFPEFSFDGQKNKIDWKREKLLKTRTYKAFSTGDVLFKTRSYRPGTYLIEIKGKDKRGNEVKSSRVFSIYDNIISNELLTDQIIIQTDKSSYDVGEVAHLSMIFPNNDGIYRVMIHYGDSIIWKGDVGGNLVWKKDLEIKESYRGNIFIDVRSVFKNRHFSKRGTILVPWFNKELSLKWESFRDKLKPGEKEKWKLQLTGYKNKDIQAELTLSLYDASLESFRKNIWNPYYYPMHPVRLRWSNNGISISRNQAYFLYPKMEKKDFRFSELNMFRLEQNYFFTLTGKKTLIEKDNTEGQTVTREEFAYLPERSLLSVASIVEDELVIEDSQEGKEVKPRENFAETVFFYPNLVTDSLGYVEVDFTMTDAVTRYKLLGYAHTKELEQVLFEKELVVQKELMVQLYAPRFLRQGDSISLRSKVMNITREDQNIKLKLELYNALTDELVDWSPFAIKEVEVPGNSSISKSWDLVVPNDILYPIKYKVSAIGKNHADAEQNILPVLSNRSLIKESLAVSLKPNETKEVLFNSLSENSSETLIHHLYKVESTANPIWYAIQALPYLSNIKHESADRLMTKYFVHEVAKKIIADNPGLVTVFKLWQNDPEAMKSHLQKDDDLKEILLKYSPWVAEGQSEARQLQDLALLFDSNYSSEEARATLGKLRRIQFDSGAFPWFSGGRESRHITQQIVTSFAHLKSLGIQNHEYDDMVIKALSYLDKEMMNDYGRLKDQDRLEKFRLPYSGQLQYLYLRSIFPEKDIKENRKVYDYYLNKAESNWRLASVYQKGLIAFSSWKSGHTISTDILHSLKEMAVQSDEMGMYWNENIDGYYWDQRKIETHALMITLFHDILNDKESVENLQIWLLQNKRTNHWDNARSTSRAIYSLLVGDGKEALSGFPVGVSVAGNEMESSATILGLGQTKNQYLPVEVDSSLAKVQFENKNNHLAFGSIYWQYFEDLDKVKQFDDGPLKLSKKLFVLNPLDDKWYRVSEENPVKVGDMVLIRIEMEVDRDLEYVYLKDERSSGLEPLGLRSGYQWNGEIGHYRSVDDAQVNFFFDRIAKGKHLLEYRLVASHAGNFSNGISRIQCMYAPEFSSHSKGIKLNILP